ncbi:LTA synthase family protein [Helicobacter equorum]|uniref:LTA synthase family protein n=1 Tax=Helicobacter equorum TaxID=361872 RepID=UPI000CF0BFC5|nr:sulfatase-like hydrolase/transferase [Helicobacter equorum]
MKNAFWFRASLWKCVVFALTMYGVFFALRLGFVIYIDFSDHDVTHIPFSTYFQILSYGLLYDGNIVGILTLIIFILGLFLYQSSMGRKILHMLAILCIVVSLYVGLSQIWFYYLYHDTFDANLFRDNIQFSIFIAPWEKYTHWKLFIFLVSCIVFFGVMRIGFKIIDSVYQTNTYTRLSYQTPKYSPLLILVVCFATWEAFVLSGITTKYLQLHSNLQKTLPNAIASLSKTYKLYTQINHSSFSDYIDQSPTEVVKDFFEIQEDLPHYDLQKLLQKSTNNPSNTQINHIFYIIVDGLNDWCLEKGVDKIGLCSELNTLVSQGAFKTNIFLENAPNDIASLEMQISGLFNIGIDLRLASKQIENLKTSLAMNFKALGYTTNFFFGGDRDHWDKLDEFVHSQGFDESFYNTQIIQSAKTRSYKPPYAHTTGAYNQHLVNLVRDRLFVGYQQKSFNVIVTTPYTKDQEIESSYTQHIQEFVQAHPEIITQGDIHLLSYLYQQDKILAKFIADINERFPNVLFVITSTHNTTKISTSKNKYNVPFILYAPSLKPRILSNVGSHVDIMPTILELVAPNRHEYVSFGKPLLSNKNSSYQENLYKAFGDKVVANERFIYNGAHIEYVSQGLERAKDKELAYSLYQHLQQARALSWWIFKNGYMIE